MAYRIYFRTEPDLINDFLIFLRKVSILIPIQELSHNQVSFDAIRGVMIIKGFIKTKD